MGGPHLSLLTRYSLQNLNLVRLHNHTCKIYLYTLAFIACRYSLIFRSAIRQMLRKVQSRGIVSGDCYVSGCRFLFCVGGDSNLVSQSLSSSLPIEWETQTSTLKKMNSLSLHGKRRV